MRRLWWVVLVDSMALGCGGSSSPGSRLVGDWIATDSTGTNGIALTFGSDGTYSAQQLELTSSTSANDEVEGGVYTATNSSIAFTPQKSSCPGPDPDYSLGYSFSGSSLIVSTPSGAVALMANTFSAGTGAIAFGCFQPDGSFVAEPIAPVGN